jgi:predicted outer membrane repeat protein
MCAGQAVQSCPLLDGLAFSSIKSAQQQNKGPIFMRDGNSENVGRCNSQGCKSPTSPPDNSLLLDTNAKVGSSALKLTGRNGGWISAGLGDSKMLDATGFTVESWIKPIDEPFFKCALSIDDCRQIANGLSVDLVAASDEYVEKGCICRIISSSGSTRDCIYGTINGQQITNASQLNCARYTYYKRPYLCEDGCGTNTTRGSGLIPLKEGSVAFVVAGANFAIGILKNRGVFSLLAFKAGPAPSSSCWTQQRLTSSSGVIGDGPFYDFDGNSTCEWIIAPEGASLVTLIFTELSLSPRSTTYIQIYSCNVADCSSRIELAKIIDSQMPRPLTSRTGVMQVVYNSKPFLSSTSSPGFTAAYAASFAFATVFAGSWNHIALTVGLDGLRKYVNGTLVRVDSWEYDSLISKPFDRGGSIGRRAAFWQDKWWSDTEAGDDEGNFYGSIDELKIWKTVRTSADLFDGMNRTCSSLRSETGLVSCFSFDQVRAGGTSFSDDAAHDVDFNDHAQVHSSGTPHVPWCQGLDDDGKTPANNNEEMWGFCSVDKPRLPGAGYDYDISAMTAAANAATGSDSRSVQVLASYPGCGDMPLNFTGNRASVNGGALYYDGCEGLDDWNDCFLQLSADRASLFYQNQADKAGGAVFINCFKMGGRCSNSLSSKNTLGILPLPRAELRANNANMYGSAIATKGRRISWHSVSGNVSTCALSIDECRQMANGLLYDLQESDSSSTTGCYCFGAGQHAKQCYYGKIDGQELTNEVRVKRRDSAFVCVCVCGKRRANGDGCMQSDMLPADMLYYLLTCRSSSTAPMLTEGSRGRTFVWVDAEAIQRDPRCH